MCYQCIDGKVAKNGTCEECPDNCEVCDTYISPPICYECFEGFTLNEDDECVACDKGCKICSTDDEGLCE